MRYTRKKDVFKGFFGNDAHIKYIKDNKQDLPSFLLYGNPGTGKTTFTRFVASYLDAELLEYNTADFRGIDTIRQIADLIQYSSIIAKKKVVLLDECHKLTNDAQNALLKLIDSKKAIFCLCTTNPEKLLKTIKSRTVSFYMRALSEADTTKLVNYLQNNSKITVKTTKTTKQIYDLTGGNPRQIEKLLSIDDDLVSSQDFQMIVDNPQIIDLARLLFAPKISWDNIRKCLQDLKQSDCNPTNIMIAVQNYATSIILQKNRKMPNKKALLVLQVFEGKQYITYSDLIYCIGSLFY